MKNSPNHQPYKILEGFVLIAGTKSKEDLSLINIFPDLMEIPKFYITWLIMSCEAEIKKKKHIKLPIITNKFWSTMLK